MDKRAMLAVVLSCLIYVAWLLFFAPRPPVVEPPAPSAMGPAAAGSGAAADQPVEGASAGPLAPEGRAPRGSEPASAQGQVAMRREGSADAPAVVVETDFARLEIRQPGARVASWKLKKYLDHEGRPYEMVPQDGTGATIFPLGFELEDKSLQGLLNGKARFDVERREVERHEIAPEAAAGGHPDGGTPFESKTADAAPAEDKPGGAPAPDDGSSRASSSGAATMKPVEGGAKPASGPYEEVRFVYSDGLGLEAVKTLVFDKRSYLVSVTASVLEDGVRVPSKLVWGPGIGTPDAEDQANRYYHGGTAVADFGAGPQRFYASSITTRTPLGHGLRWVGLEEQYFAAVFLSPSGVIQSAEIAPVVSSAPSGAPAGSSGSDGKLVTHLTIGVPGEGSYSLFVGPKDYQLLSGLNRGLADLVNFMPGIPVIGPLVGYLAKLLYGVLRWLHSYIGNYGLGIILLTTAIKIIFYPVTQRAMVKMRAVQQQMQKVQPKIKAIQESYKRKKDAAGRAKMNEEVMAVYKREGINPMASLGGCLPLLLQLPILYAFYSVLTVSIELRQAPFFGWITDLSRRDPYYITPILMGLSMFVQQKMAMTKVTDPQARMQQRMMLIMPLIFTWTFLQLPSGLVLYWFVNNILGIVQQVLINRQAKAMETAGATAPGKA